MNFGKIIITLFGGLFVGVLVVGGCFYNGYNDAVGLDENVKGAWAEVDNQLQRRFELIPNLVGTVKGLAGQEKDIFLGVAEARKSYFQASSVGAKAKAAGSFESALSRLLVLRESYPELKSNQAFLKLQDSVEGTENRLAVARKRYNGMVKTLNVFTRKLLGGIYASWAKVEAAEYFNVPDEAKATPKIDFGSKPDGG